MAQLGGLAVLSSAPPPRGQEVRDTHPLVVVDYDAGGANGEGGRGARTLPQGQALLGFWPANAHLQDLGEDTGWPGVSLSSLIPRVPMSALNPLY